jgi:hypothetical protein
MKTEVNGELSAFAVDQYVHIQKVSKSIVCWFTAPNSAQPKLPPLPFGCEQNVEQNRLTAVTFLYDSP